MKISIFVLLSFVVLARCSLLEMSQVLWARLLAGGLTKGGPLDPLHVPVIKVDQSEGNTSYRIVLRNVEIRGLNFSTLESVHIARGRLESNLSELEAGYVSYSDLRELDAIRYRFHTLVKEVKPKTEPESSAHFTQQSNLPKIQPANNRYRESEIYRSKTDGKNPSRISSENSRLRARDDVVDVVYAENYNQGFRASEDEGRENMGKIKCFGSCIRSGSPSMTFASTTKAGSTERIGSNGKNGEFDGQEDRFKQDDAHVSASESFELKQTFGNIRQPGEKIISSPESRNSGKYDTAYVDNLRSREPEIKSGAYQRQDETGRSYTNLHKGTEGTKNESQIIYQTPPGYVDILYADNDDKKIKHFAGFRSKDDQNMNVYGLEEIKKILEQHNRYVVHNFTESEALQKRNNMTRVAAESKRIQDLVRYAENYQEKQGYFMQGMQLIYHFGGTDEASRNETLQDPESNEAKRRKREHDKNDAEDDIMHVIIRLRVPLLQVKADYLLTGKVGREILRGNGLLTGNFTNLIGDFTLELKKTGKNTMIVRAARARLVADHRKVTLQGMNEKGPVESVLVHGLMAAEAVAAMIADDLATKALSQNPTTDAMIYKMYSNDPAILTQ